MSRKRTCADVSFLLFKVREREEDEIVAENRSLMLCEDCCLGLVCR